jgi:hypothetical protein
MISIARCNRWNLSLNASQLSLVVLLASVQNTKDLVARSLSRICFVYPCCVIDRSTIGRVSATPYVSVVHFLLRALVWRVSAGSEKLCLQKYKTCSVAFTHLLWLPVLRNRSLYYRYHRVSAMFYVPRFRSFFASRIVAIVAPFPSLRRIGQALPAG